MKTVVRTIPFALFSSACFTQPWTPSVPVAFWSQSVPPAREAPEVGAIDLMRRWALPETDPWAPYQKMTLLTALEDMDPLTRLPDVSELDVVTRARACARRIAASDLPPDTLFVVDLRGAASVAFGAELSRAASSPVSLVLTFNNWPAEDEVIPAEETLAALATESPRAQGGGTPVLLLDAWRLAYRFDEADPGWVDNRYAVGDLPSAAFLAQRGIRRVVYVVENLDETDVEEDDLHGAFSAWQAAGVRIAMMDLDLLAADRVQWDAAIAARLLDVRPRPIILDDPRFYVVAHGGFGGIRGTPGRAGGHAHGGHWGGSGFHGGG